MNYVQLQTQKMKSPYSNYPFDNSTDTIRDAAGEKGKNVAMPPEEVLGSDDAIGNDAIDEEDEDELSF